MSILGRVFVLAVFASSVYWVGWGIVSAFRHMRDTSRQRTLSRFVKGFVGFVLWLVFFVVQNMFGWRTAVGLAIVLSVPFSIALLTLGMIHWPAAERIISALDSDDYVGWAVGFLFVGIAVVWFGFLLFSPFGVLCALRLRPCGVR